MKLVPYEPRWNDAVCEIDASAAQALDHNGDVFLNTAVCAVSEDEETFFGFGYISRGTLNYGVFSVFAEIGVAFMLADSVIASVMILDQLKISLEEVKKELPYEKVYLTFWSDEERVEYNEFLMEEGFVRYRTMEALRRDLEKTDTAGDAGIHIGKRRPITLPDGSAGEAVLSWLDISDDEERARYLLANKKGFGDQNSEAGLLFRTAFWKARVLAWVREDPVKGREVLSAVTLWPRRQKRAATEDIFCIPEYRRQHLTEELLDEAAGYLKEEGFRYAEMNAFSNNTEALALYKKTGYEVTGTLWEFVYKGE